MPNRLLTRRSLVASLPLLPVAVPSVAQTQPGPTSHFFLTTDGVRLHYLEAGPRGGHVVVFIPGWTMPAWIWAPQLHAFARQYHVVAFDPRGQGQSDAPSTGYEPGRRALDIAELITHLAPVPVLVVAWSLGVLDTLAYVHAGGDTVLAGLVLVDNSVGEEPPPAPVHAPPHHGPRPPHDVAMRRFVRGMFYHPQPAGYLDRLTAATLHTPEAASRALLSYPMPRSYWREAVYATAKPVLYVVRPRLAEQAENLQRNRPNTETALFADAGHALFIDDTARFNTLLASFIRRRIWP